MSDYAIIQLAHAIAPALQVAALAIGAGVGLGLFFAFRGGSKKRLYQIEERIYRIEQAVYEKQESLPNQSDVVKRLRVLEDIVIDR